MSKLIVGLGNIGKEYENTNHNMGFMVIDKLAKKFNEKISKNTCSSLIAEFNHNGEKIILAKPTTYMNASGIAVKSLIKKFNIDISKDLFIISDDIDLPVSKVRVRLKGSAGTHNGLRSIVKELQSQDFPRIRIGVGKPRENEELFDFVLAKVHKSKELDEGLDKGELACTMFIEGESFDNIMQKVN